MWSHRRCGAPACSCRRDRCVARYATSLTLPAPLIPISFWELLSATHSRSNSAVRPHLAASNRGVGGPLFLELDVPVKMHRLVLEVAKEVELVLKVGIEPV